MLRRLVSKVRGFASSSESSRLRLLNELPRSSIGAEIGVWKGGFAEKMLATAQPRQLHLIDPWRFFDDTDHASAWYGGTSAKNQQNMDRIFADVLDRFEDEIRRGIVVVHRETSSDAAHTFPDDYFDWIYIDGDHNYDPVKEDLEIYGRKVKPGGLICGDDYSLGGWWGDSIVRAVDEHVAAGKSDLVWIGGAQYVLRRRP
jgi:hypothetical protein